MRRQTLLMENIEWSFAIMFMLLLLLSSIGSLVTVSEWLQSDKQDKVNNYKKYGTLLLKKDKKLDINMSR